MRAQWFARVIPCDAFESHATFLCGKVCGEPVSRCNVTLGCTIAAVPRIVAGSIGIRPVGPVTLRGKKKKKTAQSDPQTSLWLRRQVLRHTPPQCLSRTFPLTGRGVSLVRFFRWGACPC